MGKESVTSIFHSAKFYLADVRGPFRRRRDAVSLLLVLFFLVLPWVRIGGNPVVLLDLGTRKFSIFGKVFWAHDAPMLFFVFGSILLTIFFLTAVWGRFWCGWACPQTVFLDGVFRRIERWIEGDAVVRKRRDEGPWTPEKFFRKLAKGAVYAFAAAVIAHSFIAYFVGTEKLRLMMLLSPSENPGTFAFMLAVTSLILFEFAFFREQFCVILCPYGRFQSVLMDPRSMLVLYDRERGEPRRALRGSAPDGNKRGDCIDCKKCVQVCPTGIDIRNGTQMECLACTSCIDACDTVMDRLKKPKGLIRYGTESGRSVSPFRARPAFYAAVGLLIFVGFGWTILHRQEIGADLMRKAGVPYERVEAAPGGERWRNQFTLHLHNQSFQDYAVEIRLAPETLQAGVELRLKDHAGVLPSGTRERSELEVWFPKGAAPQGHGRISLQLIARLPGTQETKATVLREVPLVGPFL